MDWTYIIDGVEQSALDFKNSVVKMTGFGQKAEDLDEAIDLLTSESYSPVYTAYNNALKLSLQNNNQDGFIPTANIQKTGTTEYGAWDPRLLRVDGFLSTERGTKNHPVIVPFSSASAASAFYDLTFHVEASVANELRKKEKDTDGIDDETTVSNLNQFNTNDANLRTGGSEKVLMGKKTELDSIRTKGDNYGIASIVNPYTLTKLCGGLILTSKDRNAERAIENRLYDIRDQRRFYDKSVETQDDVLSITNPTTTNIITYSNKDPWGRTPYFFQDFVFCKYWNIIPNNRLITLRKYHAPVYDNLQFAEMYDKGGKPDNIPFAPIATVLTYFGEETGNTLQALTSFTTGVKWKEITNDINNVTGDSGDNPRATIDNMFSNGSGFTGATSEIVQGIFNKGNLLTSKLISFGKFTGLLSPNGYSKNQEQKIVDMYNAANVDPTDNLYHNKIIGPVNRINATKARDAGITFDHKLSLTCEYVSRPIGGVNTKAAMLDILANCMEIASVDAMFWGGGYKFMISPHTYPFKNNPFTNRIMGDLYKGKIFGKDGALAHTVSGVLSLAKNDQGEYSWETVKSQIGEFFGNTLGALGEILGSISNALFGENNTISGWLNAAEDFAAGDSEARKKAILAGKDKANSFFKNVNEMWHSLVIQNSIMPNVRGMHALLTGNPVGNWHVTVGNPLNPIMVIGNLICTDMRFEFSEELGPDDFPLELKVVYNLEHGMARDKGSIQSMFNRGGGKIYELPDYIRASSDYETKIDDYTGPQTSGKNGWWTPKFLGTTTLGASGYNTYKISPPKQLATNAHTDNVFIAKFTPVDVDAAISNIKGNTTFLGENRGSMPIIRGTSMTRKFMN